MPWFDPHMNWPQNLAEVVVLINEFPGCVKGYYSTGGWYDSWHRPIKPLRWRYAPVRLGVVEYDEAAREIERILLGGEL